MLDKIRNQWQIFLEEFGIKGHLFTIWTIFIIVTTTYVLWPKPKHYSPGILVDREPLQTPSNADSWKVKDYTIKPLANYSITGRVLSTNYYIEGKGIFFDLIPELSHSDLALGWKDMSNEAVVSKMYFTQERRLLYVGLKDGSTVTNDFWNQLSNNHIISANESIQKQINLLVPGDIVKLDGYLVEISSPYFSAPWRSSLTRYDNGPGACETIWVDKIEVIKLKR